MERVRCEFKYSRAAWAFLALAVGGTLALVVFVPFPDLARAGAFGFVAAAVAHAHAKLARVRGLELDCDRAIAVRETDGQWRRGVLRDGSFVAPWLTIIRWRPEGARFDMTLVMLPDMVSADDMRRIRVILKWA